MMQGGSDCEMRVAEVLSLRLCRSLLTTILNKMTIRMAKLPRIRSMLYQA